MRSRCTPEAWQARVDLAACYRLVGLYEMSDMMANHISSRVPGEDGAFLINVFGMLYNWMHRLELACRSQLAAMATGAKLRTVPEKVLEATYLNYQPQTRRPYGLMEWPALLRKLDRLDPSYRD
jgi:ribulose-5-phosphate 4-epimerase/fuculose-1-phosphate aldolase